MGRSTGAEGDVHPTRRVVTHDGTLVVNFPANPALLLRRYCGEEWRVPLMVDSVHGNAKQICEMDTLALV